MARPLRIEYPDAWYHVMNRGRRGESIFADDKDHETFLTVLQESSELFGIRVAAYCLMSNHYHLLVQTPEANLSRAMRHINGVYTQRYNRRRKIEGQLFRGRYKCVLVEEDSHLLELLRYIHRNPIRANMCKTVGDYPLSSHHAYISGAKKWRWMTIRPLLAMFSAKTSIARSEYRDFVQSDDSSRVLEFFDKKNLPSIFGTANFMEWIKEEYFEAKKHREVPLSQQLAPSITEIRKAVCAFYGISEQALAMTIRGQINEPRNLAIYLSRKLSRLKLEDICHEFNLGSYSSVSSVVIRTERLLAQNTKLHQKADEIRKKLSKSKAKT